MFFPEQEYKSSNKSEDELVKLTLEEGLTETQRAYFILTKGQQLQKQSVYNQLHRILLDPGAFDQLFEVIIEEVLQQEEDNQIAAAKSLQKLIKSGKLQTQELLQIYHLCARILKIWSLPVLNEWVQTMSTLLNKMGLSIVISELQQLILQLTDSSQPTICRQSIAILIGTVIKLSGKEVPTALLDRVRHLCSDYDKEVRLVMTQSVLQQVCVSIDSELIEMYLLEKIMELYYDTDSVVRNSGMKLFFNIAENLSPEEIKNRCVKLFLDQIQSQNEESKLAMSYVCGRVYNLVYLYNYQIHMYLTDKQQNQFLQIYKEYAKNKNSEVRHNFVYNFPAILSISIKKFDFFEQYYQLCCLDQSEQVLRCVLSSFHEVVLLAEHTDFHIKQMITYMHSQNQAILEILVNKFSLIVNAFQSNVTLICMLSQQQTQFALPSLELLVQLHNKWSLQSDFLEQLLDCQQIFTDFDAFMTALFNCISKGIPGTRKLCAQNIAKYLSGSTNLVKRQNCINQIYETFYKSNSCFNRITYLDIVESFSHLISRKLFKQLGFFDSLSYAQDPVVNVRIRLIKVSIVLNESLPQIKVKIEHEDLITQELFNEAVQNCVKSDTRSFQQVIRQTKEELLKLYDEEEMNRLDQQMQAVEDIIYQADLKQRQFQLDDLDSNMSDYKYRKKYPLSKTKVHSNIGLQSQTVLGRKEKLSAGGLLFKKAVVDMEGNKSPLLETQQKKSRVIPKSMCDVKKQFKLPSIKK